MSERDSSVIMSPNLGDPYGAAVTQARLTDLSRGRAGGGGAGGGVSL